MNWVQQIEKQEMKPEVPEVRIGDTARVHIRIVEGSKERVQVVEGVVIKVRGGANRKTITVRKISFGVGVERIFPLHSPRVEKVEIVKHARVANVAMEDSIEHRLFEDGKIVIPDFVANCGGLFGSVLEHEVKTEVIWNLLDTAYRKKISHLLSLSSRRGEPIYAIAGKESEERMASWSERERSWPEKIRRWLWAKAPEGIRVRRHVAFYEQLWRT